MIPLGVLGASHQAAPEDNLSKALDWDFAFWAGDPRWVDHPADGDGCGTIPVHGTKFREQIAYIDGTGYVRSQPVGTVTGKSSYAAVLVPDGSDLDAHIDTQELFIDFDLTMPDWTPAVGSADPHDGHTVIHVGSYYLGGNYFRVWISEDGKITMFGRVGLLQSDVLGFAPGSRHHLRVHVDCTGSTPFQECTLTFYEKVAGVWTMIGSPLANQDWTIESAAFSNDHFFKIGAATTGYFHVAGYDFVGTIHSVKVTDGDDNVMIDVDFSGLDDVTLVTESGDHAFQIKMVNWPDLFRSTNLDTLYESADSNVWNLPTIIGATSVYWSGGIVDQGNGASISDTLGDTGEATIVWIGRFNHPWDTGHPYMHGVLGGPGWPDPTFWYFNVADNDPSLRVSCSTPLEWAEPCAWDDDAHVYVLHMKQNGGDVDFSLTIDEGAPMTWTDASSSLNEPTRVLLGYDATVHFAGIVPGQAQDDPGWGDFTEKVFQLTGVDIRP